MGVFIPVQKIGPSPPLPSTRSCTGTIIIFYLYLRRFLTQKRMSGIVSWPILHAWSPVTCFFLCCCCWEDDVVVLVSVCCLFSYTLLSHFVFPFGNRIKIKMCRYMYKIDGPMDVAIVLAAAAIDENDGWAGRFLRPHQRLATVTSDTPV